MITRSVWRNGAREAEGIGELVMGGGGEYKTRRGGDKERETQGDKETRLGVSANRSCKAVGGFG
jgi:hypothetical protein